MHEETGAATHLPSTRSTSETYLLRRRSRVGCDHRVAPMVGQVSVHYLPVHSANPLEAFGDFFTACTAVSVGVMRREMHAQVAAP